MSENDLVTGNIIKNTFNAYLNLLYQFEELDFENEKNISKSTNKIIGLEISSKYEKYIEQTLNFHGYQYRENYKLQGNSFTSQLNEQYSRAFFNMDIIYLLSCDLGELIGDNHKETSALSKVLFLNHIRACSIFSEISCLVMQGLGTGAMSRLRSLQELVIISEFILQKGEPCAQAFLDFLPIAYAKEELFTKNLYGSAYTKKKRIMKDYKNVKAKFEQKYGTAFVDLSNKNEYIWAKSFLNMNHHNFGFNAIRNSIKRNTGKEEYKISSNIIHTTPISMFSNLGTIDGSPTAGGRGYVGILEPATWSIYELVNFNAILMNFFTKNDKNEIAIKMQTIFSCKLLEISKREAFKYFSETDNSLMDK